MFAEHSGNVHLRCSFTYDFSLHDSLETWWTVTKGSETYKLEVGQEKLRDATDPGSRFQRSSERVYANGFRGRAIYLNYPYRMVSTLYLRLTIIDAEVGDSGLYTCHASTRLDAAHTTSSKIQVFHRTKLLDPPMPVSAVLGGTATMKCGMRIDPALVEDADIYWTRNYKATEGFLAFNIIYRMSHKKLPHRKWVNFSGPPCIFS